MPHRLSPLLSPRSIAVIGASAREGSVGNATLREIVRAGFAGDLYPVNPKYDRIDGHRCYPSPGDLPQAPDLAVLAVANRHLETEFANAIAAGARAAAIFASGYLENDTEPLLVERLRTMAKAAAIPVCGGNCMGFYNYDAGIYICGFPASPNVQRGGVTFISHSGSTMSGFADPEQRLGFNLVISSGQEIVTTAADYIDYALEQESTRVIALFLETVRDPEGFIAALEKARAREIPVVAIKIGRSRKSAALAQSHSGAVAGNDAVYAALFERHGVQRVKTVDELAAACQLLSQPRRAGPGGIASIHDSGGERGSLIDLAEDASVRFADLSPATTARLAERLDYGLEPVNPLDAWGTGVDAEAIFTDCFGALMEDPDTAIGLFVTDRHDCGKLPAHYAAICRRVHAGTQKPVVFALHRHGSGSDALDLELTRAELPVIDGDWNALVAARCAFGHRDFLARPPMAPPPPPAGAIVERWQRRLEGGMMFDEAETLALLADFGIPTVAHARCSDADTTAAAAARFGYPVALKTAMPGLVHKSERGGVKLNLADEARLRASYAEMKAALGPHVLVAPMVQGGVEVAFGLINDPQFGPLVMVGGGGVLIELIADARFALPPFDAEEAVRLIGALAVKRLLDGFRGAPAADIDALAQAAARFSRLAQLLGPRIKELDVNPLIATPQGCLAVDAALVL